MSVKWGVLGTANIAKGCTIPGMKLASNCELYAIAGRDAGKVQGYKEEFGFEKAYVGYDSLLEDPEVTAVYIPLPNNLHKEWVIKALNAGKHVLCEKPLALNKNEVKEMFEAAERNNVILMEAYAYLHTPYISMLRDEVKSGSIGDIDYIETAFVTSGYSDDIRIRKETGGGAMYDLGCYCTTMILSLTDSEPEYVKADAEFNEGKVDIFTSALIKFKDGVRAAFNVGMMLGVDQNARWDRLYIHGSKGSIRSTVAYNEEGSLSYTVSSDGKETVKTAEVRQNYSLEIEQLGRCIEGGESPHISREFSERNAALIDELLAAMGYTSAY
ncbi:MAG: Gfo/Idh/MocA family oxidoreductase [Lachnospiraceae bacterium]|nr:Gfo/Idh/MocA family oxidoreductase [Lachnospiraceae bacterium]